MFDQRLDRVRSSMAAQGVDALLLSVGPDLPWLIGYDAMPLERLSMLVVTQDEMPKLVLPGFEVPRVVARPGLFEIVGWSETEDPIGIVAASVPDSGSLAIGDHTWSRFTIALQHAIPAASWSAAGQIVGPLRAVKEPAEIEALGRAAAGVDRIAGLLQSGEIPLIGRTEADVSEEIGRRILDEGHAVVNFAIVASGPNASSPHHHASDRVIQPNEVVLCDFGGTTAEPEGEPGYCSDITRCVYTGEPPAEFVEAYDALFEAQALGTAAAVVGARAEAVDAAARNRLETAGLGDYFVHRLGHGIGVEAHEDPYLVAGNPEPLVAGNAFSIEPGFYVDGRWGARLEDIVVATEAGPVSLNNADRRLAVVEA